MKNFHLSLAMAGLWCGCGSPTPPDAAPVFQVEYELYAPGLQEAPYLAGNAPSLGGWRPDGVKFSRVGEDVYRARFSSEAAAVECKLTLGTWDAEALDGEGFLRTNRILNIASDTLFRDSVFQWNDGTATTRLIGQVTGRGEQGGEVHIEGLLPRKVWAWMPDKYDPIETVLLLHDGRNLFDPALANFGVDWGVDEVLDSLNRKGDWGGIAAVGFDCTDERFTDYSWTKSGRSYVHWLANEGREWVHGRLGLDAPARCIVGGSSMGGLISLIAIQEHPDAFDAAICMSPAFAYKGYDHADVLREQGVDFARRPVWIDNGTVGLEMELQPGIDRMTAFLEAEGACTTTRIYNEARHFEADWGARLGEAVEWTLRQTCE